MKKIMSTILIAAICFVFTMPMSAQAEQKEFKIAWSHYVGWEPWEYANSSGILKKWADKYGITIKLSEPMDYIASLNRFTAGDFDGCVMTNMDQLISPAVGGLDSEAIIMGDYSNGNDGIVLKAGQSVADLKGRKVILSELSVSHYLLVRALGMNGLKEADVKIFNAAESELVNAFKTSADPKVACATWNPFLMTVRMEKGAKMAFNSSQIPWEIQDLMVVKTSSPESLKKALVGAWYEVMAIMSGSDAKAKEAIAFMAKTSENTDEQYRAQLKTTAMFYKPAEAVEFTKSDKLIDVMQYVKKFCFDHGLLGEGAKSADHIGIQYGNGKIVGDSAKVKMRFNAKYMEMAAEGKL